MPEIYNLEQIERALDGVDVTAAMEEGGWTPEGLTTLPFTLLINPCPASFIQHTRAVTLTALVGSPPLEES